ncbi:penicillin-insensitive murein endopeptidase [Xanthobacter tagetidis]|jgi:penicillin-insensitive murein endopeptidase|uniref:Penicillin-insensitive murein endopeptidase n=1 Tax=Xanthobacter tagetidis TaxID=60216 RepID=A0A3L7AGM3_9HYPH|nr:penicillin-insensitive murein endopeptidase [Xanthobacter tagetidis]MBB6306566.1 penicillin-insensitive murein endopeptidase [Xanthobacter tagetidis]RLP79105.1 penicillin-insensitive murein endopeptidase [Xanthobacter tagetidis]
MARPVRARLAAALIALASLLPAGAASAQGVPPALADKPAKELFGRVDGPAPLAARSIGFYSKGCLAGGVALPVNGPAWQAMRLSRNRNWGHPDLVAFVERFALQVPKVSSWPGILVGDMAQPRGGPMLTGHASHQLGLDVDVWLTPSPGREFTREEREKLSATMMVRADRRDIDPANWRPDHWKVVRLAAQDPQVERVLVNAAIKKALCRDATGNRAWLAKVRPYWGHDFHMHVRIGCPKDSPGCRAQDPIPGGEGCGAELDWWFTDEVLHPKPSKEPSKPKPPLTLAELPEACTGVLLAK